MSDLLAALLILPSTILGLNAYFEARGVDPKTRFSEKCHVLIKGLQVHHSTIGLTITALGGLLGAIWLAAIGAGVFLQHLIFEDIPNRSLKFFEKHQLRHTSVKP